MKHNPFSLFEQQIREEKSSLREFKDAYDIISDQLVKCEQMERAKDAEIERLKNANTDLQRECTKRGSRIADLKRLIIRAANALTVHSHGGECKDLIEELRKNS